MVLTKIENKKLFLFVYFESYIFVIHKFTRIFVWLTFILFSIIRSHQHQEGGALSVWCGHSVCNSKVQRRK